MMTVPVTWQLAVNTYDGEFHLFQLDYGMPGMPVAGLLLANIPGVPSVVEPEAGFDNVIRRVLFDGESRRYLCQLQGYRAATQNLEEVKQELPDWTHVAKLSSVTETGPEDLLSND